MLSHWLKDLPLDWVNQAFSETNKASMYRRKLPAKLVVWLIVAIALYCDQSISNLLGKLDFTLSNAQGESITPSAIPLNTG